MGEVAEIEMLSKPDVLGLKQNLVGKATERLVEELKVVEASQKNAQSNATHSESKQESDKDMRATEASYVARGLAKRVESLQKEVSLLKRFQCQLCERVCLGALVVVLDDEEQKKSYFVLPAAGGMSFDLEEQTIMTLTPASPIGRALIGLEEGEEAQMVRGGKELVLEVATIL